MRHWHNFIKRRTYEEKDLCLISLKAFLGEELGFHPNAGGPPFFLDASFGHEFNLSSRTLSETIV